MAEKNMEVYITFSGGTKKERDSLKDAVYNEIHVDRKIILRKTRREIPDNVKGILGVPPQLLDPDMIELIIKLLPYAIAGIIGLIRLIMRKKGKGAENVKVTVIHDSKKTEIKVTTTRKK